MFSPNFLHSLNSKLERVIIRSGNNAIALKVLQAILAGSSTNDSCNGHTTSDLTALVAAARGYVPRGMVSYVAPKGDWVLQADYYADYLLEAPDFKGTRNVPYYNLPATKREPQVYDRIGHKHFRTILKRKIAELERRRAAEYRGNTDITFNTADTHIDIVEYLARAAAIDAVRQTVPGAYDEEYRDFYGMFTLERIGYVIAGGSALSYLYAGVSRGRALVSNHNSFEAWLLGIILAPLVYLPVVLLNGPFVAGKLTRIFNSKEFPADVGFLGKVIIALKFAIAPFTGFNSSVLARQLVQPEALAKALTPICMTSALLGNSDVIDGAFAPFLLQAISTTANHSGFKKSNAARNELCANLQKAAARIREMKPEDAYRFCVPLLQQNINSSEAYLALIAAVLKEFETVPNTATVDPVAPHVPATNPMLVSLREALTNVLCAIAVVVGFFAYITNMEQGTKIARFFGLTGRFAELSKLCGVFSFLLNGWVARLGAYYAINLAMKVIFSPATVLLLDIGLYALATVVGAVVAIGPYEAALRNVPYRYFPDNEWGRWIAERVPMQFFLMNLLLCGRSTENFRKGYAVRTAKFSEFPALKNAVAEDVPGRGELAKSKLAEIVSSAATHFQMTDSLVVNAFDLKMRACRYSQSTMFKAPPDNKPTFAGLPRIDHLSLTTIRAA